ncbi:hypothetical protein AVO45_19130 [Ruegeria marisrubri]|uniref:Replication initiation factor n=1 Tax=Ruegeria marisrubri TaxID=1685379 RepID=A0A0X3TW38_9RHOB|nr:hypothetical protein [Ruegeria marisrubri]KUJ78766.1 hypothetical protein AVO45_19130 [Ruegeria marisrubri]
MEAIILHSGFDGLKFTIQADIPEGFREELASAKAHAKESYSDCVLEFGSVSLNVTSKGARGFTAHTGDHGAMWLFQDPQDRIPKNPSITVDFRAFGLATGGLEGAEKHFRDCMGAFGVKYVETQLRVARADFAVDLLAPWFEPDREALVVPPGTKVTEYTGVDETATVSSGARVVGLRAGAVANRQLAIYDKRAEVIQQNKMGWLTIWNAALETMGKPPLDLTDRDKSQVWRFEMRLGSKQLRNRFDMRNWQDVHNIIGDAFTDALGRIRYCMPNNADGNRARWPTHELWRQFEAIIGNDLLQNCAGVLPSDVIHANKAAKMRELDAQLAGLFITRAAISDIHACDFDDFIGNHVDALVRLINENQVPVEERLSRARGKYRFG